MNTTEMQKTDDRGIIFEGLSTGKITSAQIETGGWNYCENIVKKQGANASSHWVENIDDFLAEEERLLHHELNGIDWIVYYYFPVRTRIIPGRCPRRPRMTRSLKNA